jgi:alpha-tubulin suppressor-like RCC1 family protein
MDIEKSLFVDAAGRLLACGEGAAAGNGLGNKGRCYRPTLVAAMAGVRVRSVAAGDCHSLALGGDGRVYSWAGNWSGQLGHGDKIMNFAPALVEELGGVCGISAAAEHSLAVTQSGAVFSWGRAFMPEAEDALRPILVEGFQGVRVRRVCAGGDVAFAIGEEGEVHSWGIGSHGLAGHGDEEGQLLPKRVEALQGVQVSGVSVGQWHALALAEDGMVYAWGDNSSRALLGNPHVERERLPTPVEALRGVSVGSIAAARHRSYAVADTGELRAWEMDSDGCTPLGHGKRIHCSVLKRIKTKTLRGVKVDAVAAGGYQTMALADDGSVYAWGDKDALNLGVLGLPSMLGLAPDPVLLPQRVPGLRVDCGP